MVFVTKYEIGTHWDVTYCDCDTAGLERREIYIYIDDNIKMGLRRLEWTGVDWVALAQYREEWRIF